MAQELHETVSQQNNHPKLTEVSNKDDTKTQHQLRFGRLLDNDDSDGGKDSRNDTNYDKMLQDKWFLQTLGKPYGGAHTGVAVYDLNGDGYNDLLFSAGRHEVDTAFVYINLGQLEDSQNSINTTINVTGIRFSDPLPLEAGSFYQVDASTLSSLSDDHVAVLLAGGTCNNYWVCPQQFQPALLLDVFVSGCSVYQPDVECRLSSKVIWQEPELEDSGNRNGALALDLGNGVDPAIVLVGTGGLSIYHPSADGQYSPTYPDYLLEVEDKITEFDDAIDRSAGLAIGKIGQQLGLVLGTRSATGIPGPVAMVVVYQKRTNNGGYEYRHWNVDGDEPEFYAHENVSLQQTGVTLADLNGDGNVDIASVRDGEFLFVVGNETYFTASSCFYTFSFL
jgi:hypothetical protein